MPSDRLRQLYPGGNSLAFGTMRSRALFDQWPQIDAERVLFEAPCYSWLLQWDRSYIYSTSRFVPLFDLESDQQHLSSSLPRARVLHRNSSLEGHEENHMYICCVSICQQHLLEDFFWCWSPHSKLRTLYRMGPTMYGHAMEEQLVYYIAKKV